MMICGIFFHDNEWKNRQINFSTQNICRGEYFLQKLKPFRDAPEFSKLFRNFKIRLYSFEFHWNAWGCQIFRNFCWKLMIFCLFEHFFMFFWLKIRVFQEKISGNADKKSKLFRKWVKFQTCSVIIITE